MPQRVKRKRRRVLSVAVRTLAIDDPRVLAFLPSSDPRLSQQSLQITGHATAVERASIPRRKHEAGTFSAPFSPSQKLTLPLLLPMLDQGHANEFGEVNRATALLRLQVHEHPVWSDCFERALDADRAVLKIDGGPLQAQDFPESQSEGEADTNHWSQPSTLNAGEKHRRLIGRQNRPLPACRLRTLHKRRDVPRHR